MYKTLHYGTTTIDYALSFAERKTLAVRVRPTGEVFVIAPVGSGTAEIEKTLLRKAAWIRRQREFFLSFLPRISERHYVSGEGHYYLGRRYRLKVRPATSAVEEGVTLSKGYLNLRTRFPADTEHSRQLLADWYTARAAYHFPRLLAGRLPAARRYYAGPVELKWKWLARRWGTCRRSGTITLNVELIKAPRECIEYVIVHELCHLGHFNHDKAFYTLLEREWPGWRKVKTRLENLLA